MTAERGAGTVLAVAIVAIVVALGAALAALGGGLVVRARAGAAADAAALAAADTAAGLVPGDPCAVAARVARADGADLTACSIDGLVASVEVGTRAVSVPIAARARAGPPR